MNQQRFEAAKAAMQGILSDPTVSRIPFSDVHPLAVRHADALLAELARTEPAETCQWSRDEDGIYSTNCGGMWEFTDGAYQGNSVKFCPYCGNAIAEPTVKESLTPDADGWVVRVPTDPIPELHNGVRFADEYEDFASDYPWPVPAWEQRHPEKRDNITHYRPA